MAADRRVGAAAKQHEWTGGKRHRTGRIIGGLNRKAQPQQAGHDRLHQPLRQAAAAQPRRQTQQVCPLGARLGQGAPQGGRLQAHIGIDKQHPFALDLLHSATAGPVLTHPTLTGRPGPGIQQCKAGLAGAAGPCRLAGDRQRGISGAIVYQQHPPVAAGVFAAQHTGEASGDVGRFVVGGHHHRQRSVGQGSWGFRSRKLRQPGRLGKHQRQAGNQNH